MNEIEPPPQVKDWNWIWTKWLYNFWTWAQENILKDYGLEVARGNINGVSKVNKFGRNTGVGTSTETVWDGGGLINYSSTADISHVVSSSASDTFEVTVVGLDTNWDEVTQTATLSGTTGVALTTSLRRCYRMYNSSGTAAVGTIQAGVGSTTASFSAANLRAQITIGYEQTLMALYTVPANKTAYLLNFWADVNKANSTGAIDMDLFARADGGVFLIQNTTGMIAAGTSNFFHNYETYPSYSEKTDLEMRATGSTTGFDISSGFDLYLVDN